MPEVDEALRDVVALNLMNAEAGRLGYPLAVSVEDSVDPDHWRRLASHAINELARLERDGTSAVVSPDLSEAVALRLLNAEAIHHGQPAVRSIDDCVDPEHWRRLSCVAISKICEINNASEPNRASFSK